jgi:hypothetical protein
MAIDIEIWYLRSLSFILIIPSVGPSIFAIGKMVSIFHFSLLT